MLFSFFAIGCGGGSFSVEFINRSLLQSNKNIIEITNLLDNRTNQWCISRTKDWVKIKGDALRTHNKNSQIKLETAVFKKLNNTIMGSGSFIFHLTFTDNGKAKGRKEV